MSSSNLKLGKAISIEVLVEADVPRDFYDTWNEHPMPADHVTA